MNRNLAFSIVCLSAVGAVWLLLAAAPDPTVAHFPALSLNGQTNVISDNGTAPTFNGTPIGGGGGGSAPVGTVVNTGTSTTDKIPQYSDTTGTNVAPVAISGDATLAAGGALTLKNTGTAGTYGDASHFPVVTTDAQGRVTTVTANLVSSGQTNVSAANPTATASGTAINGTAATFMRSDAAPAISALPNSSLANSVITINGTSVSLGGTRTLTIASADFANQGTTTTLLHGNAAGNPSFGAVALGTDVSGTLAAAQFPALTGDIATSAGALATTLKSTGSAGTYTKVTFDAQGRETSGTSATLASADYANQGTTTTVLHGNGAGNPSFGSVVNADIAASTIDLTAKVTGVLPVLNGGTGSSTATGSGLTVLQTSPSLVTPALGAATATTLTVQTGVSGTTVYAGGTLKVDSTANGNGADSTEDTLTSYTVPAGVLGANTDSLEITAFGTTAANATAKTIKMYFGSTVVLNTGAGALNNDIWSIRTVLVRTGATAQLVHSFMEDFYPSLISPAQFTVGSETLANALVIKCTGKGTAANDVVQKGLIVRYFKGQ